MSETSAYIVTANAQNFQETVLTPSIQVPVLVDFWAAWCAPCQALMPVLTKLADAYAGQFILAKVNSDEEQALAQHYNVRGIPALKLFRHGEVVEETTGVQSETALRQLIDRHRARPADKLRLQAQALYSQGNAAGALALLEQAYAEDDMYLPVIIDWVILLMETQQCDQAEAILQKLPANLAAAAEINLIKARLAFAKTAQAAPSISELERKLAEQPDDHASRYQLSAQQVMLEHYEAALENLLTLMQRNRAYADDAGRRGLLAVFELLGNDPLVSQYRAKMARLLY